MKRFTFWLGAPLALAALVILADLPADATSVDTGTIYYGDGSTVYSMNPDGTSRTSLFSCSGRTPCEPCARPHGCPTHGTSERWFLQLRPYDSDPGDGVTEKYPNGIVRHELFAVCEGGTAYRLTDDSDLEPDSAGGTETPEVALARPRWFLNDTRVSYVAKKWVQDANGDWEVGTCGIHVLSLDPENLGSHVPGTPTRLDVPMDLVDPDDWRGGALNAPYDWDPDGTALVYKRRLGNGALVRADYQASSGTWSTTLILAAGGGGWDVRWSPAEDRIVFLDADGNIDTMDPYDTTDRQTIVQDPADTKKLTRVVDMPFWSPSGTHVIYRWHQYDTGLTKVAYDVYRVEADGSNATNLTSTTDTYVSPLLGWAGTGNPPTVTITQPSDGSSVWGTVTIKATATDDGSVSEVEFFVDGSSIGTDTTSPYEVSWDSTAVAEGSHTISAVATDDSDETDTDSIVVTVDNIDDAPQVAISDPDAGDTVSGTSVTIAATASDDGSVSSVEFFVDGSSVGTDSTSPYQVTWNSTGVSDGSHTISAKATDDAGKTDTDIISVTVDNAPPSLTVTSITPDSVRAGKSVNVTVSGAGFAAGASLALTNGSGPSVTVSNVSVVDSSTITATIAAARSVSKGSWTWDVLVTNPGGASATLEDGFTVKK